MTDPKNILQDASLKSTAPRLAILESLAKTKKPTSAQELHKALAKKGIDLVTIYRTLASFEKAALVKRLDLRKDAVFYELSGTHHHHIVCTSCGDMEDFETCDMESLSKKIAGKAKKFKAVSQHSLELFGVCTACSK